MIFLRCRNFLLHIDSYIQTMCVCVCAYVEHSQLWRLLALREVLLDSHHTVTQSSSSRKPRCFCQRDERTFTMLEPCSITRTSSLSSRPVDRPHTNTHTHTMKPWGGKNLCQINIKSYKSTCHINLKSYKNLLYFPTFSTLLFVWFLPENSVVHVSFSRTTAKVQIIKKKTVVGLREKAVTCYKQLQDK